MRGIQQTFEEIQQGKYEQYKIDRCSHCKRILRVSRYDDEEIAAQKSVDQQQREVQNQSRLEQQEEHEQSRYHKKRKAEQKVPKKVKAEVFLQQQEYIQKEILKIVEKSSDDVKIKRIEDLHQKQNDNISTQIQEIQQILDQQNKDIHLKDLPKKLPTYTYLKKQKVSADQNADKNLSIIQDNSRPLNSLKRNSDIQISQSKDYQSKSIMMIESPGQYFDKIGLKKQQAKKMHTNSNKSNLIATNDNSNEDLSMPNLQKIISDLSRDKNQTIDQSNLIYKRNERKDQQLLTKANATHRIKKSGPNQQKLKKIKQSINESQIILDDQQSRLDICQSLNESSNNVQEHQLYDKIQEENTNHVQNQTFEQSNPNVYKETSKNNSSSQTKIQHNYNLKQDNDQYPELKLRSRSTIRTNQQNIRNDISSDFRQEINNKPDLQQVQSQKLKFNQQNYNYYKNDLSFLEPQQPINLPEIKPSYMKNNIEQELKNQTVWHQNGSRQNSQIESQKNQSFQFKYYNERKQSQGQNGVQENKNSRIHHNLKSSEINNETKNQSNIKTQQNYYSNYSTNNTSKASDFNNQSTQANPSYQSYSQNSDPAQNSSKRFSNSRDGHQNYQNYSNPAAQNIKDHIINSNSSKYTNIKEEKAKVSKILEEFERKQKLERELRLQSQLDSDMIFKSNHSGKNNAVNNNSQIDGPMRQQKLYDTQTQEQQEYVENLLKIKPWLGCLPLKASKLEFLKKSYPLDDPSSIQIQGLEGKDKEDFQAEVKYALIEVVAKRNMLREKKSDYELLMDARYFNKYGEYLFKRLQSKNYYQRLEVGNKDAQKSEIKKAYYKLALIWHPDNIKKKQKYGFAHELSFTKLVAEIFVLFEEAYKTLSNETTREQYDKQLKQI